MNIDVIIPALNEEDSIERVINDIPKNLVRTIYVCDNGSSDATAFIAKRCGAEVLLEPQKGYGAACLKGIQFIQAAKDQPHPDVLVFLDADYSDDPKDMTAMVQYLQKHNLDLVIGSRVLGNAEKGSLNLIQRFGNWLATQLIWWIYKMRYTDLGPFRAIRYASLQRLNMVDQDYGWTVEMQVKAAKLQLKVEEIPVRYKKRIGVSKVSGTLKGIFMAGYKIIITIFRHS